jgi:hypothetical protein
VLDAVFELVFGFVESIVESSLPESRWGRALLTILCIAGIAATGVIIYLALSGRL